MARILIAKRIPYLDALFDLLGDQGEVAYAEAFDEDTLAASVRDVSVIVATRGAPITRRVIASAPDLRVIAAPTAGYDGVDVDAATAAGIPVVANTGASADTVAVFSLGLVIALTRRMVFADRMLRSGSPYPDVRARFATAAGTSGIELDGCNVGIVGLGAIGSAVARRFPLVAPVTILAYDPYVSAASAAEMGVELVEDVVELCASVDVLMIHAALTDQTWHLVDQRALDSMKPTALLVNCSRGELVDQDALVDALRHNRIGGAALDVFETEPLPGDSPLLQMDNVITTPHIAGVSVQSDARRARTIADRIKAVLAGSVPEGLVNPEITSLTHRHGEEQP